MNNYITPAKAAITGIFAAFTALFGWVGWLTVLYVGCMVTDWLTGSAAAAKEGNWNSKIARQGLWHKFGSIVAVAVSAGADWLLGMVVNNAEFLKLPFAYTVLLCPIVLVWYILTELGSIIENAGKMGAPIPAFLKKVIAVFKDTVDDAGNNITNIDNTE